MDTSCILGIPDTQAPAHHRDTLDFLAAVKKKYRPSLCVHIGDLADFHRLNFHGVNPNLPSAPDELSLVKSFTKGLSGIFTDLYIMESNHDALPLRRARSAGIPDEMLKDVHSIIQAPKTWKFKPELVLKLPNKITLKCRHNFSSKLIVDSQKQNVSLMCGHFHTQSYIQWWMNDYAHNFAMQIGSLVDRTHPALDYQRLSSTYPVLTVGIIKNGIPMIIPMLVKKGRWIGHV